MFNRAILLFLMFSTLAFTNYQQSINAVIMVTKNDKNNYFQAMFRSSDWFDHYRSTIPITSGNSIVSHLYNNGPKNIKFRVGMYNQNPDAIILASARCDFLTRQDNLWFETNYQRTIPSIVEWVFTFSELRPWKDFNDVYHLGCDIYSQPPSIK